VYRARRRADERPVVIKVLEETPPLQRRVTAMRHEFALLRECAADNVVRAYSLEEEQGRIGIVMEDTGSVALKASGLLGKVTIEEFLEIALQLAEALEGLHTRRVIHKDINPANLLIHPETRRLHVIDFGIATVLPDEEQGFSGLSTLEGTLAYLSPEQTGRMNRTLDERTDLYSLGVTLFELLTGRRPFLTEDPVELVHCHIARKPPSPAELVPGLPQVLSDVLLKLLAKNADQRYRSARGLRMDLARCLDRLRHGGGFEPFALGGDDRSERIHFPQRLYGRDAELKRLLEAFEQTKRGAVLVLVSGYAGIGKTALIQEVHRPLTAQRGYFVAGKYDQFQNVPHGAFIQALEALVRHVLTESETQLGGWSARIREALGANAAVIAEVCPSLRALVGPQPVPASLPPDEARNRFHEAVHQFVSLFARPEHPLCLFIDDLQWADADSLKLLQDLMHLARERTLLVVGSYRDNEVNDVHPLRLTIRQMETQGTRIEQLALGLLSPEDAQDLLADTLGVTRGEVAPLAHLVLARTGGNPFFVRTFIKALRADGLLQYSPSGWRFDIDAIRQRGITDNVVHLLASRIARLPPSTRELLQLAACIGNRFDLGTLAGVAGLLVEDAGCALWDAIVEGLMLPLDRVHSSIELTSAGPDARFRFVHDRIQEAVLAPLDEGSLVRLHRDVGRKLLQRFGEGEAREAWLFEIVGQLNLGRAALSEHEERDELAHLNLRAARRALKEAAFERAQGYARAGLALLTEEDWTRRYELARDLHACGIESAFARADFESVHTLAAPLLRHARTPLEEARVRRIEGQVLYAQMRLAQAIDAFANLLGRLGFPLPSPATPAAIGEEMRRTHEALATRELEELARLPHCADEAARAALDVLNRMLYLTSATAHPLYVPVVCKAVQLSLQHGNTAESALALTYYGTLLVNADGLTGDDIARAARIGRVALAIADQFEDQGTRALVYMYAHFNLLHWERPLHDLVPHFLEAYRYAREAGSPFSAACSVSSWSGTRLFSGDPLGELAPELGHCANVASQLRQDVVRNWLDIFHQMALNLSQETAEPTRLIGTAYDEETRVPKERGDAGAMANVYFCKTLLCYLFDDREGAVAAADAHAPYEFLGKASYLGPLWSLLESLARLGVFERSDEAARAKLLERVAVHERRLATALPYCPKTIAHKLALVQAERARVEGRAADARAAFERAVALSRESGYVHEEAIACELAARFHLGLREVRTARGLFREAHEAYLRWGAVAKAKQLERQMPHMVPRVASVTFSPVTLTGTRSGDWDINVLDLVSVINASQLISREVDRAQLLMRLMDLLVETGGAEFGVLLREHDGRWLIEAAKNVSDATSRVLQSVPLEELEARGHRGLPASVVNFVARTGESLVVDDASASPQFRHDPYIVRQQVSSILCFPLPRQSERRGLVYLENNLMKGAFTPGRIKILLLLSTQAVISLDNAVLYRTLEQRVEERTRELQEKNEELVTAMGQLREAQERMIVQDRLASLGTLAAGVAHELRNPLNFVANFAEVAAMGLQEMKEELDAFAKSPRAETKDNLSQALGELETSMARIKENSRRMQGIISSMLEHSRGGTGERRETDLNSLVEQFSTLAVQGLGNRLPSPELALQLDLDPTVGRLLLTPQEISRVLLNLIANAGYAVGKKREAANDAQYQARIRVSTRNAGDVAELRVYDNGVGIPHGIRDRVFNPFFTTKPTGEGTGLGLSICHDIIVKSNRGSIRFDSVEGEFTEFVISIPKHAV
jgi:predicted ATPase/signal transduction histidine kinase/tRNA A-37 threonylcarbamoyl transferase component Bud32